MATVLAVTPSTELEAVNLMLSKVGESPVSQLDVAGYADLAVAQALLSGHNRSIQSRGWVVNSEENYPMTRDSSGKIVVPVNLLKARVTDEYASSVEPVVRGGYFYDRMNHTFTFATDLKMDVVWLLKYEELNESLRRYIAIAAARNFQQDVYSSTSLDNFTEADEMEARAVALNEDAETAGYNMLDHYSTSRALFR